jgi:hypothetical protein
MQSDDYGVGTGQWPCSSTGRQRPGPAFNGGDRNIA